MTQPGPHRSATTFCPSQAIQTSVSPESLPEPLVGIWWDDSTTLVAFAHPITENTSGDELVDSNLSHDREWPLVCHRLGRPPQSEYFEIPRGRVIFNRRTLQGIIYHGNATPQERLKTIAAAFHLADWISCPDDHYAIGVDADAVLDDP